MIELLLTSLAFFNLNADVHWPRWFLLQMLCLVFISYQASKRIHWSAALCFFVMGASCVYTSNFRYAWFNDMGPNAMSALQSVSAKSFMAMILMGLSCLLCELGGIKRLFKAFFVVGIVHSLLWISQLIFKFHIWEGSGIEYGLFGNTSMGACFNAMILPLVMHCIDKQKLRVKLVVAPLLVAPIYLAQSSMGILVAICSVGTYYFFKHPITWKRSGIYIGIISAATLILGPLFDYQFDRFMHIDRWEMWQIYLTWWADKKLYWFGSGFGTFMSLGPGIQQQLQWQIDRGHIIWLHSDWIQILFETGIVGLTSCLILFFNVLKRAIESGKPYLPACVLSYALLMMGNYPTQLALFGFYGLILAVLCLRYNHGNTEFHNQPFR